MLLHLTCFVTEYRLFFVPPKRYRVSTIFLPTQTVSSIDYFSSHPNGIKYRLFFFPRIKYDFVTFKGDLSKAIKENCDVSFEDEIQRKQWAAKPFKPLMFPLEVTASAMEGRNT